MLLVQKDKCHIRNNDPEAQVITEASGASAANNEIRRKVLDQPPLLSKVMGGITLRGTMPTFYRVLVTTELVTSVRRGAYPGPNTPTVVYVHIPNLPRPDSRWSEGMKPLDNRDILLSCYKAFKTFVNRCEWVGHITCGREVGGSMYSVRRYTYYSLLSV